MSLRLSKQWVPLNPQSAGQLKGELGVFQLGNENKEVIYIGSAGSRSQFGLRGEITKHLKDAAFFRIEVTSAYSTRFQELLMLHHADFGCYPTLNSESDTAKLGKLSPMGK
tara:strand:+ start:9917 stop:10249 length:333 start_codon:yes stop_codon:yes gene_type:complete